MIKKSEVVPLRIIQSWIKNRTVMTKKNKAVYTLSNSIDISQNSTEVCILWMKFNSVFFLPPLHTQDVDKRGSYNCSCYFDVIISLLYSASYFAERYEAPKGSLKSRIHACFSHKSCPEIAWNSWSHQARLSKSWALICKIVFEFRHLSVKAK